MDPKSEPSRVAQRSRKYGAKACGHIAAGPEHWVNKTFLFCQCTNTTTAWIASNVASSQVWIRESALEVGVGLVDVQ